MASEERRQYERRFRRAGLPLLIEDYNAREDVFTRAIPFLGLVFLSNVAVGANFEWPAWANWLLVLGGLAVLVGAVAWINVRAGRRALSVPPRVGTPELLVFVFVPALLPLAGGGQIGSALGTIASNLVVLGLVYVVVGYGLLSIVRWAARRLFGQLATSVALLSKAVPLLLFFALVLFVNTEFWQVFGDLGDGTLAAIVGLFVGLGTLFLSARLPREVALLEREVSEGTPPLSRRQRFNVALVMFVSHALQVLLVAAAVGAFFVVFGALAISEPVASGWLGHPTDEVGTLLGGRVSEELVRVSVALAAFSGLYYAIAVLTDSTYRVEFLGELEDAMRETFRARRSYLALEP